MTRRSRILEALLIGTIVLSGCGFSGEANDITQENNAVESAADNSNEGPEKNVELTERQKAILEKEGLPTDYYELEGQQQDAITRIELCLDYLDRTYPDDTFTYLSYEGFGFMSGRSPLVYALSEKIGEDRCVSVGVKKFDGQYKFYDDYKMVRDSDVYQEEITKYVRSQLPDAEFFVDATIHKYVEGDSYIMERATGYSCIVFNDTFETEQEVKEFLEGIADWMNSYNKDRAKTISCEILYPEIYKEANLSNYTDLRMKKFPKLYGNCVINVDQDVNIHVYK